VFLFCLVFLPTRSHAAETPPRFLGSQSCATSLCHGGAEDRRNEFHVWLKQDFHTRAHATLTMARSARMAEALKIADASTDARCTVCHNPFQTVPAEFKDPRAGKFDGVSCESCHNAAERWLLTHTRTDLKYEQKVAAGMRDLKNLYVRANTCIACHQNLEPDLRAAGHPELIFEMDGQCATMPRHWSETNRVRKAQAWWGGQAVALREAAAQNAAVKPTDEMAQRANALAWLLGVPNEAKAADELARRAADESWSAADVQARLSKLLATHNEFAESNAPSGELVQRAERVALGLERLSLALGRATNSPVNDKLEALFQGIQSRPEFDPKTFSNHLKDLETSLR